MSALPSQVLSLAPSNVPGRRLRRARFLGGTFSEDSFDFGALPRSAGFGALRGLRGFAIGALPKSIGFGGFKGLHCVMCSQKSLGGFGAVTSIALNTSQTAAIKTAIAAAASAKKPAAVAAVPAASSGVASAAPVIHTVALAPSVASNFSAAASSVAAGAAPSVSQAVNIIKAAIPAAPGWKNNLPQPSKSGSASSANLSGLTLGSVTPRLNYGSATFGRLGTAAAAGAGGAASSAASLVLNTAQEFSTPESNVAKAGTALEDIGAGATVGAAIGGPVGAAVGAAVGAIIGIVGGLFGAKKAIPKVSATEITQCQQWMAAYTQVAGSVVGRNFTASAISDLMTAIAVLDPGFWGWPNSQSIVVTDVSNFVNNELPIRLNDFFTACAGAALGATITMKDDPSILGHGKTNLAVTYSFPNPGVNAPSYVLGPYFAQYFFVMCGIFQSAGNCVGHLTAPLPQLYTDILDWYRSTRPNWDTPQPNVVTGTDLSISSPTQTSATTYVGPATAGPTQTVAQTQTTFNETSTAPPLTPTTPIAQSVVPVSAVTSTAAVPQLISEGFLQAEPQSETSYVPTVGPSSAVTQVGVATSSLLSPVLFGLNVIEIAGIALVAWVLLPKKKSHSMSDDKSG